MQAEDKYIGKQIGNYRIIKPLNSGAFGRVYEGAHIYLTSRAVAIKLLHSTHLGSDEEEERFLQEASYLEILKHSHILPIYDVGIEEGFPYIVAELAQKGSLRDLMDRYDPERVPLDMVLDIVTQVGQGLQFVHEQSIVHRDLKPENILFNAKDEALLADFGIAVFLETTKTKYANVMGSPLYMAPEQFEGIASRRSDQYSLACIVYELVTGHPPFVANHALAIGMKHQNEPPLPPSLFNADLPAHVEQAILKAMSKQRDDRFPDIASFINALLTTPSGTLRKTREQWLDEGNTFFASRRYQEAYAAFERAIQIDPAYADAYEGKGIVLYSMGQYDEALKAFEYAIRLDHNYAPPYCGIGNILAEQERYDDALKYYARAAQLDPSLADTFVGRGNALYYQGHYEEALISFDQAIHCDSACVPAHEGKGWALQHLKRYEESIRTYNEAIKLDPNNPSAYTGRGRSLYRLGRYEEALNSYKKAVQIDPDFVQAYDFMSDVYYYLHRYEEALPCYEKVITLNPDMVTGYEGRGWTLIQLGRYQEALAPFERAMQLDPQLASAYNGKGRVLYLMNRYKEALTYFERAVQLNPRLASAHNDIGNVLSDLQRYEEALASYDRASKAQPREGTYHYNKATTLKQLGRQEEAQQEFALAKQLGYAGA